MVFRGGGGGGDGDAKEYVKELGPMSYFLSFLLKIVKELIKFKNKKFQRSI